MKAAASDRNAREHVLECAVRSNFEIKMRCCDFNIWALFFQKFKHSPISAALFIFQKKICHRHINVIFEYMQGIHLFVKLRGIPACDRGFEGAIPKDVC